MKLPLWICHQKPERCLRFRDKLMPLCARCLGLYLFIIAGFVVSLIFKIGINLGKNNLLIISIILVSPLMIDSLTQALKLRESNNLLRFLTGALAGSICGIDLHYLIAH
jgi:uncharacterized membrane protein